MERWRDGGQVAGPCTLLLHFKSGITYEDLLDPIDGVFIYDTADLAVTSTSHPFSPASTLFPPFHRGLKYTPHCICDILVSSLN